MDSAALRRCSQCQRHFASESEFASTTCSFHPGEYWGQHETLTPGVCGKAGWWSCCLSTNREGAGCTQGKHAPDLSLEKRLARLGRRDVVKHSADAAALAAGVLCDKAEVYRPETASTAAAEAPADETPEFVVHRVLPLDTLVGVAMHYGCTERELLSLNNLPSAAAFHAKAFLRVPAKKGVQPPAGHKEAAALAERALAVRRLREAARTRLGEKVSAEEAGLYLDDTEGGCVWEAAFAELQADVEWERTEGQSRARSLRRVAGGAPLQTHRIQSAQAHAATPAASASAPAIATPLAPLAPLRVPLLG